MILLRFQGAVIKEQGVTFAVVVVKKSILDNRSEADRIIRAFQSQVFRGLSVVLMAQDSRGVPVYYGNNNIAKFMASVPLRAVPWREYSIN